MSTKEVIVLSVKHLTPPPFANAILLDTEGRNSKVAAPVSPREHRKRPWPVCPPRLAVLAKLTYQLDVHGQTHAS